MDRLTVIIASIEPDTQAAFGPPPDPSRAARKLVPGDLALGGRDAVDQDDRHAPVVELEEAIVRVDVGELRLDAELLQEAQGVIAQVTALASDEDDDSHGADPSER